MVSNHVAAQPVSYVGAAHSLRKLFVPVPYPGSQGFTQASVSSRTCGTSSMCLGFLKCCWRLTWRPLLVRCLRCESACSRQCRSTRSESTVCVGSPHVHANCSLGAARCYPPPPPCPHKMRASGYSVGMELGWTCSLLPSVALRFLVAGDRYEVTFSRVSRWGSQGRPHTVGGLPVGRALLGSSTRLWRGVASTTNGGGIDAFSKAFIFAT